VCEAFIKAQETSSKVKTLFSRGKKNKKAGHDDEDEEDAMDEEEERRMFQQSRRGIRNAEEDDDEGGVKDETKREEITDRVMDKLLMNKQAEECDEDFHQSPKFYFGKYYMLMLERLQNRLQEETHKLLSTGSSINISFLSSSPFSSNFNNLVRSLRAHIFLANNLDHLIHFATNLNLLTNFKKLDANFESSLRAAVSHNVEKACEIFVYLNSKWEKWVSLNVSGGGGGLLLSQKSQVLLDNDDITLDEETENAIVADMGSAAGGKKSSKFRFGSLGKKNSIDSSDKVSLKSSGGRTSTASSVFKFPFGDAKKKRKDEFTLMLKETIVVCMKLLVEKESLARIFRERVIDQIGSMLHFFESTGDLRQWIESYNIKIEERVSLSEKVVEAFFCGVLF
jgi:hypothetical protein